MSELQDALDFHDTPAKDAGWVTRTILKVARRVADPDLTAMGMAAFKIHPFRFTRDELRELIDAALGMETTE